MRVFSNILKRDDMDVVDRMQFTQHLEELARANYDPDKHPFILVTTDHNVLEALSQLAKRNSPKIEY